MKDYNCQFIKELEWNAERDSIAGVSWNVEAFSRRLTYYVMPCERDDKIFWEATLWTEEIYHEESVCLWSSQEWHISAEEAKSACQKHFIESVLFSLTLEAQTFIKNFFNLEIDRS